MPLYEYACESCGHRFEVIQKFSDAPLETCPKCGGPVRKLQSAPAFQFKGSGWYITDYARKEQGAGAKDAGKETASEPKGTKDGSEKSAGSDASASTGTSTPSAASPPAPSKD
jgi:putative FmdB family regulatory protein